jgi:hypothetical protein
VKDNKNVDKVKQAVSSKNSKYADLAAANNFTFIPFIVDSFGNFESDTLRLVKVLINKAWLREQSDVSLPILSQYWMRRLSCTIHRLQSQLLLSKYKRVSDAAIKGREEARDECFITSCVDIRNN